MDCKGVKERASHQFGLASWAEFVVGSEPWSEVLVQVLYSGFLLSSEANI